MSPHDYQALVLRCEYQARRIAMLEQRMAEIDPMVEALRLRIDRLELEKQCRPSAGG